MTSAEWDKVAKDAEAWGELFLAAIRQAHEELEARAEHPHYPPDIGSLVYDPPRDMVMVLMNRAAEIFKESQR